MGAARVSFLDHVLGQKPGLNKLQNRHGLGSHLGSAHIASACKLRQHWRCRTGEEAYRRGNMTCRTYGRAVYKEIDGPFRAVEFRLFDAERFGRNLP